MPDAPHGLQTSDLVTIVIFISLQTIALVTVGVKMLIDLRELRVLMKGQDGVIQDHSKRLSQVEATTNAHEVRFAELRGTEKIHRPVH